ncbi:hypothetical protein [Oceanobacillus sp. CF4.6]|uniref:hypothetical protein n=1 Tax=Oceanobacillus sp. CF4.6 TaxID=3373080 RepID=UPI003EE691B3
MPTNDEFVQIKQLYDKTISDLEQEERTYKDLTVEEYKEEVKLFWMRTEIWEKARAIDLYSEKKLEKDFKEIKMSAKELLL